jgi:hypothetical protein
MRIADQGRLKGAQVWDFPSLGIHDFYIVKSLRVGNFEAQT